MHLFYIMVEMHFQDQEHRVDDRDYQLQILDSKLIMYEYENMEVEHLMSNHLEHED